MWVTPCLAGIFGGGQGGFLSHCNFSGAGIRGMLPTESSGFWLMTPHSLLHGHCRNNHMTQWLRGDLASDHRGLRVAAKILGSAVVAKESYL